jgi:hypothetical protein
VEFWQIAIHDDISDLLNRIYLRGFVNVDESPITVGFERYFECHSVPDPYVGRRVGVRLALIKESKLFDNSDALISHTAGFVVGALGGLAVAGRCWPTLGGIQPLPVDSALILPR